MQKPVKRLQSWEVSDELWAIVEPLIPERQRMPKKKYTRKAGGGRKPLAPRRVFEGIVFVLRTGIQWKALPPDYGASSSVHQYFQEWEVAGVFKTLWERGVKLYDQQRELSAGVRKSETVSLGYPVVPVADGIRG